jgi:hypothetical protein
MGKGNLMAFAQVEIVRIGNQFKGPFLKIEIGIIHDCPVWIAINTNAVTIADSDAWFKPLKKKAFFIFPKGW